MAKPEIPINMKIVDDLLIAGCTGVEVAAHIGCHADTLYKRIENEKGMQFTAYSAEKRLKGESLLRAQQYAKALGLTKNGDNMMLIWLGKNRLNQKDNKYEEANKDTNFTFKVNFGDTKPILPETLPDQSS